MGLRSLFQRVTPPPTLPCDAAVSVPHDVTTPTQAIDERVIARLIPDDLYLDETGKRAVEPQVTLRACMRRSCWCIWRNTAGSNLR